MSQKLTAPQIDLFISRCNFCLFFFIKIKDFNQIRCMVTGMHFLLVCVPSNTIFAHQTVLCEICSNYKRRNCSRLSTIANVLSAHADWGKLIINWQYGKYILTERSTKCPIQRNIFYFFHFVCFLLNISDDSKVSTIQSQN